MSEYPVHAYYWKCKEGHKNPKRTLTNFLSAPVEYLECVGAGGTCRLPHAEAVEERWGDCYWVWKCSACSTSGYVCYVSWARDTCHNCGSTWLVAGGRVIDMKKAKKDVPSPAPKKWEPATEEDKEKAREERGDEDDKPGKKKHRPILDECPGDCPAPHAYAFSVHTFNVVPAPGEEVRLFAVIDPPLDSNREHGELRWTPSKSFGFYHSKGGLDTERPLVTSASRPEHLVARCAFFDLGKVRVPCTFTSGGKADKPMKAEVEVDVGGQPPREEGEVEASRVSPFRLDEVPPARRSHGSVLACTWRFHDFAVGESAIDVAKVPTSVRDLLDPLLQRLGKSLVAHPAKPPFLEPIMVRRGFRLEGFSDLRGPAEKNSALRDERANAVLMHLAAFLKITPPESPQGPEDKGYEGRWVEGPVDLTRFVADNLTPEGRAQNRCVLIRETAEDVTVAYANESWAHVEKMVDAERRARYADNLARLRTWLDDAVLHPESRKMLELWKKRVKHRLGALLQHKLTEHLRHPADAAWNDFLAEREKAQPEELCWVSHVYVEQWFAYFEKREPSGEFPPCPSLFPWPYRQDVETWLIRCLARAEDEAAFVDNLNRMHVSLVNGVHRLQRFRIWLGGAAGEDNHPMCFHLANWIKSMCAEEDSVYAIFPEVGL